MDKTLEHKIGEEVEVDSVARLRGKKFKVVLGNSCTMCDFTGLGHVLCPKIACSGHERTDGHGVVYREVK
jgi:hypothetical protein